jgi:hypothetical protein
MKQGADIEVVDLPAGVGELAERRCRNILQRTMADYRDGKLEFLIRSCYLQGVQDGYEAAHHEAVHEGSPRG